MCGNMDETAIDLLSKMVQLEPAKRISAKEALNHPYFNDFNPGFPHNPHQQH